MNYFSEIFGLVTKNDPVTENGGLFFAHYLVLKMMLSMPITSEDYQIYMKKMSNAKVEYGLYLRSKEHKKRTVSQDEQTGFSSASYILELGHHKQIWEYIIEHYGSYPATGENKFYNPGSYYAWAVLADSKISFLLAPWYTLNLLISSNKPKENTSSKLIYITELYLMKEESFYSKILWKYFVWRMELMYGKKWIKSLYDIYFGGEELDHPLRILSRAI